MIHLKNQTLSREERAQIAQKRRADLGVYQKSEVAQNEYSAPRRKQAKRKKTRKKKHTGLKVLVALVSVVLLAFWGISGYIFKEYKPAESFSKSSLAVSSAAPSSLQHIAIFGVDSYDGHNGRADSTMILTIDKKHGQIKLTSIQRDSCLPVKGHGNDKLTHAFAYGGAELMLNTINSNFNMNITEYVVLNYKNVADMIDLVGGLDMEITEAERKEINRISLEMDSDAQTVKEAGTVHLNGLQTTAFARIRKIDSETKRTARQREVISKLVVKLKEQKVSDYPGLLQDLVAIPTCSLTKGELMNTALSLLTCDTEVRQYVIPSEEDHAKGGSYGGFWCWRYDVEQAADRWHDFLKERVPSAVSDAT